LKTKISKVTGKSPGQHTPGPRTSNLQRPFITSFDQGIKTPVFPRSAVIAWAKQIKVQEITAIRLIEMKGGRIMDDGPEGS
jgi:hypothetical protein